MLSNEDKRFTDYQKLDKRNFLADLIQDVESKQQLCANGSWTIGRKGGPLVLRDMFSKIVLWINKFREVGDFVTQFDPVHAALPWAGVRLLLQV